MHSRPGPACWIPPARQASWLIIEITGLNNNNMYRKLLLPFLILFTVSLSAQQQGWRDQEMEISLSISSQAEADALHALKLNGDIYLDGKSLFYVTPEELEQVKLLGITYEVVKEDLNNYFDGFWANRDEYHSYEEIIQEMNSLVFSYPSICQKFNYGLTIGGREMTALKISDNVSVDEQEAELGFDGGIHGDEIGGPENLIRFAQYLCEAYGSDPEITNLIDNREIWLFMMVNPDGRANMSRYNLNGVDMNRDWGYMWDAWGDSPGAYSQPEVKSLRSWFYSNQFVIHICYHSGAEEVVYPWSYRPDQCPDNDHIDYLANIYSTVSGYPFLEYGQGYSGLYPINGSSKDSYYGVMGSVAWTMELSNSKQPPTSQIQLYFDYNLPSMMAMIKNAGYGIHGMVTDAITGEPIPALLFIDDYFPTYSDPEVGDYHKFLLPANYTVTAIANGYQSSTKNNITVNAGMSTACNFTLQPNDEDYIYRVVSCQIPDNNFDDEGATIAVFGAPDDISYSIGREGWVVLDMGSSVLDGPGDEIRVHEGDTDTEGYTCYAGVTMDGPWIMLDNAQGTTSFDFGDANILEAGYIRIEDDGDGSASGDNAGFDLDAIEVLEQPQIVYFRLDYEFDDAAGNGDGRPDPGETVNLNVSLRNHGGLTASNTMGNLNYDSAWVAVQHPDTYFGDIAHTETGVAIYSFDVDTSAQAGQVIMMVLNITANEGTVALSFPFGMTLGALVEDWETNGFEKFDWSFDFFPWVISPVNAYEGIYSAKSSNIGDNQVSVLEITLDVLGYDNINFYRKVSSQAESDYLMFSIDGNLADQWSGAVDWGYVSYEVTPGLHTFTWAYVKDESGSFGIDCGWIDYITLPSANLDGSLYVIANALPHQSCDSLESQLSAFATGGTGSYTYSWTPDEYLSNASSPYPSANPVQTTVYSVEVSDGSELLSSAVKLSVHLSPETPVIGQQGDSIISSAAQGNQWYNSNGLILGATGQVYHPLVQDTYYVIVTSLNGCISEASNTVNFMFTGIEILHAQQDLKVYPNPVKDILYIEYRQAKPIEVDITDLTGRKVYYEAHTGKGIITIPVNRLSKGVYLVSVKDTNGQLLSVSKVVK